MLFIPNLQQNSFNELHHLIIPSSSSSSTVDPLFSSGLNRTVHHNTMWYNFSPPAMRYLSIIPRKFSGQNYYLIGLMYQYFNITCLVYTRFVTHKCNQNRSNERLIELLHNNTQQIHLDRHYLRNGKGRVSNKGTSYRWFYCGIDASYR